MMSAEALLTVKRLDWTALLDDRAQMPKTLLNRGVTACPVSLNSTVVRQAPLPGTESKRSHSSGRSANLRPCLPAAVVCRIPRDTALGAAADHDDLCVHVPAHSVNGARNAGAGGKFVTPRVLRHG